MIIKPTRGMKLNRRHPLARGLVGCWIMNEGTGDKINDLSGYGRHGIYQSTTAGDWSWGAGLKGMCLHSVSNHTSGYGFSPSIVWGNDDDYTIIIRHLITNELNDVTVGEYNTGNNYIYCRPTVRIRLESVGVSNDFSAYGSLNEVIDLGIVVCGSTDTMKAYGDGVYLQTITSRTTTSFIVNVIGSGYDSPTYNFNGDLFHVYFYDRALTAEEIAWLYREPYAMFEWNRVFNIPIKRLNPNLQYLRR